MNFKITEDVMLKYNDRVVRILHLLPPEVREIVNRGRVEEILSGLGSARGGPWS